MKPCHYLPLHLILHLNMENLQLHLRDTKMTIYLLAESPPFVFNGAMTPHDPDNFDSTTSSTLPTSITQNNAYTHSTSTIPHGNAPSSGPCESPPFDFNGAMTSMHLTPSTSTKFSTQSPPFASNNACMHTTSDLQHNQNVNAYQEHLNGDVDMTHGATIRPYDTSSLLSTPSTTLATLIKPPTSSTSQSCINYKYTSRPHQGKICTILFPPSN